MEIRLNKFLAQRGIASRREADRLIEEGRVAVNGRAATQLGTKIDDAADRVAVDGRKVKSGRELVYMALNKPAGILVTLHDPLGRPTVKTMIRTLPEGVRPVGRLDKDSEGLLLLTSDGELAFRLTHPRYEVAKTYLVRVQGEVGPAEIDKLAKGIPLDGRITAPARLKILESRAAFSVLQVEIHEGRKREVRRMFESVGHEVLRLVRMKFAGIALDRLEIGAWRFLTNDEIRKLKRLVGLETSSG